MDTLDKRVIVFVNDVCIYSNLAENNFKPLKNVFTNLYKHAFYCKLKKYSFF